MPGRPAPLADRFWSKVDRSAGPLGCWPWLGSRCVSANGRSIYGHIRTGGRGSSPERVHRVALYLTVGPPPPDRPEGCHAPACTTTLCCNPGHLRWGTRLENLADIGRRREIRTDAELIASVVDTLAAEGIIAS